MTVTNYFHSVERNCMDLKQSSSGTEMEVRRGQRKRWQVVLGIIISLMAGSLIGFYGVIVSVFADSMLTEKLVTIAVILLIYFVLSGVCSFLLPNYGWRWGIPFCAPGELMLAIYTAKEWNPYYLIYIGLIAGFAFFGAWTGSSIRKQIIK